MNPAKIISKLCSFQLRQFAVSLVGVTNVACVCPLTDVTPRQPQSRHTAWRD
jgi:hypothetical protein